MDAFFASIEQRDNPDYQGKPLVVGGNPDGRGVVAAASYEARTFGIRSAMTSREARKRCPQLIFTYPRFDVYRTVSQQIHTIFAKYTPLIEPLSLDEAYLDVSDCPIHHGSATLIAGDIRQEIWQTVGLTASAGVSFNKMLAKIASDINKPNGIAVITPQDAPAFIDNLPIERFFGIGKATTKRLHEMGIFTGLQLKNTDPAELVQQFGKRGKFYYNIAHLQDEREVKSSRIRKSIGSEITFDNNLDNDTALLAAISEQNHDAHTALLKRDSIAYTVTLKIKYSDFSQITRSHSQKTPFMDESGSMATLVYLFHHIPRHLPIRLVGVSFSNLVANTASEQLDLFGMMLE